MGNETLKCLVPTRTVGWCTVSITGSKDGRPAVYPATTPLMTIQFVIPPLIIRVIPEIIVDEGAVSVAVLGAGFMNVHSATCRWTSMESVLREYVPRETSAVEDCDAHD